MWSACGALREPSSQATFRGTIHLSSDSLACFEREAKSAAFSHYNVISLYDFGVDDGVPYLTMELLDGETLRAAPCARAVTHDPRLPSPVYRHASPVSLIHTRFLR